MIRHPLVTDLAIAAVCALIVLIVSPGVAVDAMLALIVLLVCGVTYALGHRRRRGSVRGFGAGRGGTGRRRLPRP